MTKTFRIDVVGLPDQISREFLATDDSETRLNQIRFVAGETRKEIALRLYLPELTGESGLRLDQPLRFSVIVLESADSEEMRDSRLDDSLRLRELRAGRTELELVPRGIGRLQARISNLYRELHIGEQFQLTTQVKNSGTRRLANVRVSTELPPNWLVLVEPELVEWLEVGQARQISITFIPQAPQEVGDFNLEIETSALSGKGTLLTDRKTARIRVTAPSSNWQTAVVLLILLSVIGLIILAGIRIARQ